MCLKKVSILTPFLIRNRFPRGYSDNQCGKLWAGHDGAINVEPISCIGLTNSDPVRLSTRLNSFRIRLCSFLAVTDLNSQVDQCDNYRNRTDELPVVA